MEKEEKSLFRHLRFSFLIALIAGMMFLTGCADDGEDGRDGKDGVCDCPVQQNTPVKWGVFLDGAVEGLSYSSGEKAGFTDPDGLFWYEDGKTVTFKLGDILIGEAPANQTMTPVDLVQGATSYSHPTVVNIIRFLQTLDEDSNPYNGIRLTENVRYSARGVSVDFSNVSESELRDIASTLLGKQATLVSQSDALLHYRVTLLTVPGSEIDQKVQKLLEERYQANNIPGIVAVMTLKSGRKWVQSRGYADKDTGRAITSYDKFRIGSCTKTFTALTILQLAQEGKLSLDDSLEKWMPGLLTSTYDTENITIRQLLNHSSGLYNFTTNQDYFNALLYRPDMTFSPTELINIAAAQAPEFAPGAAWHYNNTGYVLMGMIIEKITGNTWEQEVQSRFINPLGLSRTIVPQTGQLQIPGDYAEGYLDFYELSYGGFGASGVLTKHTGIEPSTTWASGNILSTPTDLARWIRAILEGELLNDTYMNMLKTDKVSMGEGSPSSWTLGLINIGTLYGHPGQLLGYDCAAFYDEKTNVAISSCANRTLAQGGKIANVFIYDALAILYGEN